MINDYTPLLLLTGCVNPEGMYKTALQDAEVRAGQYVEALNFYLKNTNARILFVENSGYDLSPHFKGHEQRLEILTFMGNNFDKSLGKGYGEMKIVRYALDKSVFIQDADWILKITGRLKIKNIQSILKQFNNNSHCTVIANLQQMLSYCDSRCWAAGKDFYINYFLPFEERVNDSMDFHFEHALARAVHLAIANGYQFNLLANLPRYSGISGTENKRYDKPLLYWFLLNLKHQLRRNVLLK